MKLLFILLVVVLLSCFKKEEAEIIKEEKMNKLVNLDEKSWEKLNIFFSKLYQYDVPYFEENKLSDDELIKFAVIYNLLNLQENIEKVNDDEKYSEKVSAKNVHNVIKKYFGKDFTNHKTIIFFEDCHFINYEIFFKDNYYYIPKKVPYIINLKKPLNENYLFDQIDLMRNPTKGTLKFIQVNEIYQINETDFTVDLYGYKDFVDFFCNENNCHFIVELNEYRDNLYTPDELNDNKFYNTKAKNIKGYKFYNHNEFLKAKIRKVQNDEYIVLEIKIQEDGYLFSEGCFNIIFTDKKNETEVLKKRKMNKPITLNEKSWEKLNIFFSKLYQYDVPYFRQNKLSETEFIKFAVRYNLLNLPENIEKVNDDEKYSEKVSAKNVHNVIKKYFGKNFTNDKTITFRDEYNILFKDNYYYIPKKIPYQTHSKRVPGQSYLVYEIDLIRNPTIEMLELLQVKNIYQNNETDFTVELYVYRDDLKKSDKLNDSKFYNTKAEKLENYLFFGNDTVTALIRKIQDDEYIVLEYLGNQ